MHDHNKAHGPGRSEHPRGSSLMNHTLVEVTQYEVDADVAKHLITSDWSRAASNKGARHTALPTMLPNT